MIIIDPVALGDAVCTRATPGTYWNRAGALLTAAADVFRVTYDPGNLDAAPYALIEPGATNRIRNNTMQGAVAGSPGTMPNNWQFDKSAGQAVEVVGLGVENGIEYVDLRFSAANNDRPHVAVYPELINGSGVVAGVGQSWASSIFLKVIAGTPPPAQLALRALDGSGAALQDVFSGEIVPAGVAARLSGTRAAVTMMTAQTDTARLTTFVSFALPIGQAFDFTVRVGLPQLERDRVTNPIKTTGAAGTRSADVLNTTAGLLYSSVEEPEPLYAGQATAKGSKVRDTSHVVYEALVDNANGSLSDTSKWLKLGATNRCAMFDDRNNTQTVAQNEIIVVVSPRAICQGLFLGNMDANEVLVSMVDQTFGVVHGEVANLIVPTSGSSFFRWCFNRIRRRSYFLTLKMPVFANPLITVVIRKDGSQPKCGMCMIGPAVDVGLSEYGLSTELKDYSTTTFNVDGTSNTIKRGYSKRMSVDLSVESDQVEGIEEQLISYRQKTVVWVGATFRGDAILCGKYSSFKKVIESYPISKMALQIEGVVS